MEEIERILIGTALTVRGAGVMICKRVTSAMFSDTGRVIFEGIKKLIERRSEINISNISAATGIEPLVFRDYVQGLHGADIDLMIDEFLKSYRIKVEYQAAIDIQIATTQKDYEQIEAIHAQRNTKISETFTAEVDPDTIFDNFTKKLQQRVDGHRSGKFVLPGITTGHRDLDMITGGHMEAELIIIGGDPGAGKTSFALDMAISAEKAGHLVGIVSVEMTGEALVMRLVAHQTGIDSIQIRDGRLSDTELQRVAEATDKVRNSGLKIFDNLRNIDHIKAFISDQTHRFGVGLWIVDYLQIINSPGNSRAIQVSHTCAMLLDVAKSAKVPVVAISSLSRPNNTVGKRRPRNSDLKESGDIEYNAHKIFLFSEDDETGYVVIDITKNRSGSLDTIQKMFVKSTGRWFDPNEPEQMTRPETSRDIPF